MSAERRRWERTGKHPKLPGEDLGCFELHGQMCLYDRDNPQAYIVGDSVRVGTEE